LDVLSSNSFLMLEKSLGYLWTKQSAIADNITNAETPGYKEKVVTFEDGLRGKLLLASRKAAPVKSMRQVLEGTPFAVTEQTVQTRMDDNGVNVTGQMSVGDQRVDMLIAQPERILNVLRFQPLPAFFRRSKQIPQPQPPALLLR